MPSLFQKKAFISACHKIESNSNYQPKITNEELLALVVDENGRAKYSQRASVVAIQPTNLNPQTPDGRSLGKLYQIKLANKLMNEASHTHWVVEIVVAFVNQQGEISLHSKENAENGVFDQLLSHLSINQFLNCASVDAFIHEEVIESVRSLYI